MILSKSFLKYLADPSDNIAIATKPACLSFQSYDYNAGTIILIKRGNKNFTFKSPLILAKQS